MKTRIAIWGKQLFVVTFLLLLLGPTSVDANPLYNVNQKSGPFLDRIEYHVITQDDQQVLALQDNEIDLIGDFIDPSFVSTLEESENIQLEQSLRNGYGYITINCEKYPYNITDFRRAFAFAFDKNRVSEEVWDGFAIPIDSCLPSSNPWSIEGQLPYNYYDANVEMGIRLLERAGFFDIDDDGYREAPDGSNFSISLRSHSSSNIAIETCEIARQALESLNIDVSWDVPYCWCCWGHNALYYHGDYDMAFLGSSFSSFDCDWLAYEFWSEYADEPFWNFPNFRNSTYDSWRDQLLYSTSIGEVEEAVQEMQEIWIYECPMVICYENYYLTAYRTDRFEGFVNDVFGGVANWWTNFRVQLKDGGPLGGTLRWSNPLDLDSFNFMVSSSKYTKNVLDMLSDSLIKRGPNGEDILWLAESYTAETHLDNERVPIGNTRFTFEIVTNATWSDGTPLTAEDIAFTLNYYRNTPRNPYGHDLQEMSAAYAPTWKTVVVEFSSESIWHLHTVGYKPIIPKHVFIDIGADSWNLWNPQPPEERMVTSGPFNVSEYVPGEYTHLVSNPNYFRFPLIDNELNTETNSATFTNPIQPMDILGSTSIWHWTMTFPSVGIIVIVLVKWRKQKILTTQQTSAITLVKQESARIIRTLTE